VRHQSPLRQPHGALPLGLPAVPASVLDQGAEAARTGRRSRAFPRGQDQGADRFRTPRSGAGWGLPGRVVLADAGYGVSEDFRNGLAGRELSYIVGVTEEMVVFAERPRWVAPAVTTRGHPQTRPHLADDSARPISLKERAVRAPRRRVTWREGSQQTLSARFAWVRVWPGQGWADGEEAHVRLQQPAGGHPAGPRGAAVEESLAGGAGLPADEGGVGPGSFRGPLVARVSSPCLPGDAGVWFLGPGTTASETAPGDAGKKATGSNRDHAASGISG
jgi:hypothetical protein